jgi:SAM-dependent methyltransferase
LTKHDALTQEEFTSFVPNGNITRSLEAFTAASGRSPSDLRVLDWGCGRGRQVLWLRQRGYQAYGVEVDALPVENGLPLLESYGYSERPLALLDSDGRSPFPDGFFDFILSGNVLEHVADLEKVCAEIARVTRTGGGGYHVFPAQRQILEGHLFMPFVHWLPPGRLRKALIRFWVRLGREPHWVEVHEATTAQKADFYYNYSLHNVFYRSYRAVRLTFEKHGLAVTFTVVEHPRIKRNRLLALLMKVGIFRALLNYMLLTFKLVEMQVEKIDKEV